MKKILISLVFIYLGVYSVFSQDIKLDKEEIVVNFTVRNFGINVKGSFSDVKIDANFDKNNLKGSYFSGIVKTETINTGNSTRDSHLKEEGYFDVKEHPNIKLVSKELKLKEPDIYEFIGELSIKGKTESVTFPIIIEETSDGIIAKANFKINRRDFKVGGKSWVMSKTVKISIIYKGS